MNYIRFKELLLKLGMITDVTGGPSESQESNLILELWQLLQQPYLLSANSELMQEDITLRDAKLAIMSILRLQIDDDLKKKKPISEVPQEPIPPENTGSEHEF